MRKALVSAAFVGLAFAGFSQQDPQFSQNMNNRLFPNPGVAGSNDAICATLLGRNQWVGFEGRPESYLFSAHAPFTLPFINKEAGAGLSVISDRLGQISTVGVKGSFAYRQKIPGSMGGKLGIGVGIGFVSKKLGNNWKSFDPFFQDPTIPDNGVGRGSFDLDFGLYYKNDELYFGLSTTHLTEATLAESFAANPDGINSVPTDFNYNVVRHYYLMAGYDIKMNNPLFVLQPSIFVKSEAVSTQVDLNMTVLYNNFFWGGVTYRLQDAIVPIFGVNYEPGTIPGTFRIGYSYDFTTSQIRKASSGSHEIFLGYCFKIAPEIRITRHKTVRFL